MVPEPNLGGVTSTADLEQAVGQTSHLQVMQAGSVLYTATDCYSSK